jgi:hypothetical protein
MLLGLCKAAECFVTQPSIKFRRVKLEGSLDDGNENSLSERIQQLREKEDQEAQELANGLSTRVQELQESQEMERLLETHSQIELPVVSFDSLLPNQTLEGTAEDPTFCCFLRDLGLGGWFVMTSLNLKSRKIRRQGVLAKIQGVDAISKSGDDDDGRVPTAVDFVILGHSRCRVIGPREGMQQRIGRWRRGYDPNGEESALGWGTERFVDAPKEWHVDDDIPVSKEEGYPCTEWSSALVDVNLEAKDEKEDFDDSVQDKMEGLITLVDQWCELATNVDTFQNLNVTASTRIRREHPGLWVDPEKLLQRVSKQLGPRPHHPTAFCFWAAALINPLPSLGVSLEIRGQMLEAPTIQRRLEILEYGLIRSIDNLKGKRAL